MSIFISADQNFGVKTLGPREAFRITNDVAGGVRVRLGDLDPAFVRAVKRRVQRSRVYRSASLRYKVAIMRLLPETRVESVRIGLPGVPVDVRAVPPPTRYPPAP